MRLRRLGPVITIHTPAKVNLQLAVLGRRDDGFHELDTVMAPVSLYDTLRLTVTENPDITLDVRSVAGLAPRTDHGGLRADESNLVVKAARLLAKHERRRGQGVHCRLVKRIPTQAGLGGGSSDAAATLVGLNVMWDLGLSRKELHSAAAQLGSDVNVFLDAAPLSVCTGRGEVVSQSPLRRKLWFALLKPTMGLSTKAVFDAFKEVGAAARGLRGENPPAAASMLADLLNRGRYDQAQRLMENDLQRAAEHVDGTFGEVIRRARAATAHPVRMSGSGTACYVLCRNRPEAVSLAGRWSQAGIGRTWVAGSHC